MRWLSHRSHNPRTPSQPRSSAQRGSSDLLPEDSPISSNCENTNSSDPNDNGGILQEVIPREYNSPRRWTNQLAMGDATLPDPDDLIQAIYAEEELGWRSSATTQPAAPRDNLDILDHPPGEPLPNYSAASTQHNPDIHTGELARTVMIGAGVSCLGLSNGGESVANVALPQTATIVSDQHVVEPHNDIEDDTTSAETYHDALDLPSHSTLRPNWQDSAVVDEDPGLSAFGDGASYLKPSISSPTAAPKKKARRFPLAIPKPSFNFIPKKSTDTPKQPTRSKSILPKLRGGTKSDGLSKPATTKQLRFSTEVHSSKPATKRRLPLGRKKAGSVKKSSLVGTRSGEISPLTTTEPESSFVLPPFVEPTDIPTEPTDAPGSTPKPKPHKPSRSFFKPKKRIPLTRLSPTAVSPIPGQPYEHIPSPEEPNPHKKLRLGRLAKPKAGFQRGIRQWRKFTLRKSVLQIMLGRQLAGPVAANLKILAGRKTVLEGGPGTGLWGIADGGLGERSLSGRAVG
ncbi:hypothetical protein V500_00629 [Pseudogymnoascus sp. VKM F-4518 (FW-2643)]|nr:hypothetical protein V500_00629 [Pseudogymnoascus sp. VKM F-4518 (FW-2643)]